MLIQLAFCWYAARQMKKLVKAVAPQAASPEPWRRPDKPAIEESKALPQHPPRHRPMLNEKVAHRDLPNSAGPTAGAASTAGSASDDDQAAVEKQSSADRAAALKKVQADREAIRARQEADALESVTRSGEIARSVAF